MNREELTTLATQEEEKQRGFRCRFLCCASTPCLSSGGTAVAQAMQNVIKEDDREADVQIVATGCMGPCSRGPVVTVQQRGQQDVVYEQVTPELAREITEQHIAHQAPLTSNVLPADLPFFAKQQKVVLVNSGRIDPERLEDALAHDGYRALDRPYAR